MKGLSFGDELIALGARVRENVGPHGDRTVILFPDGDRVVLDTTGNIMAATERAEEIIETLRDRTLRSVPSPPDGYDPATDCLLVDRPDGEVCLVGPWRCALPVEDHLIGYGETLGTLRAWAENCLHAPLRVWTLRRGAIELEEGTL
jgi:hypothetical protein